MTVVVTQNNITSDNANITALTASTVNSLKYPDAGPLSNRNLVQNGAMTISQRTTSTSSLTSGNNFILDRWRTYIQDIGTYTISQASDAPTGFRYSYKIQCTTADASPAAADDMSFYCAYEGQDFQHLKKGTASAQSVTLSFWVKSNKTTTGQVNFRDLDNSRMISGTYTINSAGTWEYKTITFAGDTSGVLDNDNAASISLQWYLDSGSNFTSGSLNSSWGTDTTANRNVNNFGLASSTSNYWQITGIQLEVGTVATPFEHRSYGDELARCKRYFQATEISNFGLPGYAISSTQARFCASFFPEMRDDPTLTTDTLANFAVQYTNSSATTTDMVFSGVSQNNARIIATVSSGLTAGQGVSLLGQNVSFPKLYYSAEL